VFHAPPGALAGFFFSFLSLLGVPFPGKKNFFFNFFSYTTPPRKTGVRNES
jgi:hypothetical protein